MERIYKVYCTHCGKIQLVACHKRPIMKSQRGCKYCGRKFTVHAFNLVKEVSSEGVHVNVRCYDE